MLLYFEIIYNTLERYADIAESKKELWRETKNIPEEIAENISDKLVKDIEIFITNQNQYIENRIEKLKISDEEKNRKKRKKKFI